MKTMYIRYDGWTPSVLGDAVSGQVNTLRCSFAFSSDWDEYKNRKAIFETDEAKKEESLDENGVCRIPRAVLMKRGKLKISAYGTETGENGELLRYNGRPAEIIVDLGGNVDGEITDDPVYPQIGEAVLYTAQSLTDAQKAQARANIGAGTPYTLPEASTDALGGIKADAAAETDTKPVRIGEDGKLYTAPGGDTSIGITGASAGQIPKVKAVDESGAPTEWKSEKDTTPFIVTVGGDEYSGYTSSHTFDEIAAAASAGRVVMAYSDYIHFPQVGQSLYGAYFDLISTQDTAVFVYIDPLNMIKYTFAVDPFSISASASYLSATSSTFGGIKADAAETADTQPVRIGGDGKLYTAPGGGGADISLGISGATAGQVAKIKSVDASGAPTEWEAGDDALPLLYHGKVSEEISGFEITEIDGNPMSLSEVKVRTIFKVSTTSWCGIELCTSAKNPDNKLIKAEGGYVNAAAEKYYMATAHGKISNGNFEINAVQPTQFTPYLNMSSGINNVASIKTIPNFVYNKPPELQEMNAKNGRINTVKIGGNLSEVEVIIWGR